MSEVPREDRKERTVSKPVERPTLARHEAQRRAA
jgi:hypothetical protein